LHLVGLLGLLRKRWHGRTIRDECSPDVVDRLRVHRVLIAGGRRLQPLQHGSVAGHQHCEPPTHGNAIVGPAGFTIELSQQLIASLD
jgi:hypothetical protein